MSSNALGSRTRCTSPGSKRPSASRATTPRSASAATRGVSMPTRSASSAAVRRAAAVDKERAIAENELANRIELARRTSTLVEQEGANERKKAAEAVAAARIAVDGKATNRKVEA